MTLIDLIKNTYKHRVAAEGVGTKVEGMHDALVEKLVAGLKVSRCSVGLVDEFRGSHETKRVSRWAGWSIF